MFIDSGPWYPWKADTTWYEPHPTIQDYRLHEKWFPGAPTLATHPDGQNGGVIKDDGKTYPPSMFVEGRPDLEYFGMGVDPPETTYESVGTVATAHHFHSNELWAGFDEDANDELDSLGRPLPFIAVFEDEIVALVEEFLWRRRRARWLGKPIPSLDPLLDLNRPPNLNRPLDLGRLPNFEVPEAAVVLKMQEKTTEMFRSALAQHKCRRVEFCFPSCSDEY